MAKSFKRRHVLILLASATFVSSVYTLRKDEAVPFGVPNNDRELPEKIASLHSLEPAALNSALIYWKRLGFRSLWGQGVFLSGNVILTAAHVAEVFLQKGGVVRIKHRNELGKPSKSAIAQSVYFFKSYDSNRRDEDDLAIIVLKYKEAKKTGVIVSVKTVPPMAINAVGYWGPGWDLMRYYIHQYRSFGLLNAYRKSSNENSLGAHDAPTLRRWSGCPMYVNVNNVQSLAGIHVSYYEYDTNIFVGFSKSLVTEFNALIAGQNPNQKIWRKIWERT